MTVRLRVGAATDVGRVRSVNQDSFLVLAEHDLYAVADGMGGHQGGEVASKLAIDALRAAYLDPSIDALSDAIEDANLRIHDAGQSDPSLQGMGTTVVVAAIVPDGDDPDESSDHLLIANVGDSRAYLFRDGELTQLTEDHSMVADLMREGRITEAEAEVHPQRNIVTRVLGVYDNVEIDLWPVDPVRGDRVVLCSDGLFNEVSSPQIAAVLRRLDDPQDAAAELIRLANEGGGRDNVTVIVLDVVDDGGVARAASAALADEHRGSSGPGRPDLAGFSTALEDDRDEPATARRGAGTDDPPKASRERTRLRTRLTWRGLAFLLAVLLVLGGAFATIQWYGTSTYFVSVDGNEVTIFKGRPGGILWIDPEAVERTDLRLTDIQAQYRDAVSDGVEHSTRAAAERYVDNITTTTTTTTTTTLPPGGP